MGVFVESLCILSTDNVDILVIALLLAELIRRLIVVIESRHLAKSSS